MEWVLGAIALIVTIVVGYFTIIPVADQTRKEFRARQPDIQLVRAPCISAGGSYAALLTLHNIGKTPASNGTISLDGWPGIVEFGILLPVRPGFNECEKSIEIGQGDAIRGTKMDDARLWIRYRDQWGYAYEVSYPVLQVRGDHGLFDLQIQKEHPKPKRPRVSFRKMRRILRETPG